MEFFRCEHCGNIVTFLKSSGLKVSCCGRPMKQLVAGAVDAATEKHVPVVTVEGSKVNVNVGSVQHPMTPEHSIGWIALETKQGNQVKQLTGEAPVADFVLAEGDEVVAAYEYCNLHGLWKS